MWFRFIISLSIGCGLVVTPLPIAAIHLSGERTTGIDFPSWTPNSFGEIFSYRRDPKSIEAIGILTVPQTATEEQPAPAVILLHGSSGGWEGKGRRLSKILVEQGIAGFVVDTFSSRLLYPGQNYLDRLRKSFVHAQLADAYAAFDALKALPYIDADRVAVAGFSMGGLTTLLAVNERIAEALQPDGSRFVAHISYYSPCNVRFATARTTGAPILMMVGGKDEATPVDDCRDYAADFRRVGSAVNLVVFEAATHGWDATYPPRFYSELPNPAPCSAVIADDGTFFEAKTGESALSVSSVVDLFSACSSHGYTSGRNADAKTRSNGHLTDFLKVIFNQ